MQYLNGLNKEKALKILSFFTLLSALAAVVYTFIMGFTAGFSVDEVYTSICTNPSRTAAHVWNICTLNDANPPFYIWFMYAYNHIWFTQGEFWLRLPGIIAWFTTLACTLFLFPKRYGKYVKWCFVGFLTCSAYLCLLMVQARSYAFSVLISFFITFLALDFFDDLHNGRDFSGKKLFAFFAVSLLGCYVHYFCAVIFVISSCLLIGASIYKKRSIKLLVCGLSGVLALYALWIGPSVFMQKAMGMLDGGWDGTAPERWKASTDLFEMAFNTAWAQVFVFLFTVAAFLSLKRGKNFNYFDVLYPAVLFLLTFTAILILSLKLNLMRGRYFLVLLPSIYFLCAFAIGRLIEEKPKTVIVWLVFLALAAYGNINFFKKHMPFTMAPKSFAQQYMANFDDTDLYLVSSYNFTPYIMEDLFSYYLKDYYKKPMNIVDIRKFDEASIRLMLSKPGALIYTPTCTKPVLDTLYSLTTTRIMFFSGKNNYCLLKVVE